MSLLKNPTEINEDVLITALIYGQPGVGKTTLALSSPNSVLIDADGGMRRVEKRFQVPSLPMTDYKDLLALFEGNELDPFDTIVFDTLGKLVDRIGDHLGSVNPKNRKSDGALTMQGYGALKIEFSRLLRLAQTKRKHLIFVAHEREEKDGEDRIVRPDVSGSSGKDLVKELDLMGYMEMRGGKRTISFNPAEKFYAKNSLKLPPIIDVPDTLAGNTFIQTHIIDRTKERLAEDDAENKKYQDLLANLVSLIVGVKDAKSANEALATIDIAPVIWDSTRVAKKRLAQAVKDCGLVYDKETKAFKINPKVEPELPIGDKDAA
jgi:hypothetical protein